MGKIIFVSLFFCAFFLQSCSSESNKCCKASLSCNQYCVDLSEEFGEARKQDLSQCAKQLKSALQNCDSQDLPCQVLAWEENNTCLKSGEMKYLESLAELAQCREDCKTQYEECKH